MELALRPMKKVLFACCGLGKVKRGMEVHVESLFHNLSNEGQFRCYLAKGGGETIGNSFAVWNINRDSWISFKIEKILKINRYFLENLTFFASILPKVITKRFTVIYLGDFPLYNFLYKWRKLFRSNYSLIFFTGGQTIPGNFDNAKDVLHHVTDEYLDLAIKNGIPAQRQYVIPHFIDFPINALVGQSEKESLRKKLSLPKNMNLILSVGAITAGIKRMDYVIEELSKLPQNYCLVLVGNDDYDSDRIRDLGLKNLGAERFICQSVPHNEIWDYYRAADLFVLASNKESFGLVMVEALHEGLPVIADDYPASREILTPLDICKRLEVNTLAKEIPLLIDGNLEESRMIRRESVLKKYRWISIKDDYITMFQSVA